MVAFEDLDAPHALELLAKTPDPVTAARLSAAQIGAALKRARRRNRAEKATAIQAALRTEHLTRSAVVTGAHAATVQAQVAILNVLQQQITALESRVEAHFGQHPDAETYTSQPGLGVVLGARVLAEFGDDPHRYADARARKNYAGTSPITRQSGKKKVVLARHVHNDRLIDALTLQAFTALRASPGARGPLRQATRPRPGPPRGTAPTRQPPRRHPARLPQDRHHLRRDHRLAPPDQRSTTCCLTSQRHGMSDSCHLQRSGLDGRSVTCVFSAGRA